MDNAAGARTSTDSPFQSAPKLATLSRAKEAWFAGDFDSCLQLCVAVRPRGLRTSNELILLRTRALLRLRRVAEALSVLDGSPLVEPTLDEDVTARMLLARAKISSDEVDSGLAILESIVSRAESAHATIRSEIALAQALGHWTQRDLVAAEVALDRVAPDADIVTARARNLRAWCYAARGNYRQAANYFLTTVDHLRDCLARDQHLVAASLTSAFIFAAELFDDALLQSAVSKLPMIAEIPGTAAQRFQISLYLALHAEMAARPLDALKWAARAGQIAPAAGYKIMAHVAYAAIADRAGEPLGAAVSIETAIGFLPSLKVNSFHDEEAMGILWLAEEIVSSDPTQAAALFTRYRSLGKPSQTLGLAENPLLVAYEKYVRALILEASGERTTACSKYREAFRVFRDVGYVRRASIVALRLIVLTGEEYFLRYVEQHGGPSENWIQRRAREYRTPSRKPLARALSRTELAVLQLVCEGKTNDEIARLRERHPHTIGNMISTIFTVFGVKSRTTLINACIEYGFYHPKPHHRTPGSQQEALAEQLR